MFMGYDLIVVASLIKHMREEQGTQRRRFDD